MATGITTPTLPNVPARLTISILYSDDDIVVIDKPCDLRSVPGHANPPPPRSNSKKIIGSDDVDADDVDVDNDAYDGPVDERMPTKPQSHRRTAQEAWVEAIKSCCSSENDKMVHGHEESRDISSNGGVASIIGDKKDEQKIFLSSEEDTIKELLNSLGTTSDPSAVPRKVETFIRYCQRNRRRLLPSLVSNSNPVARSSNIDTDQSHQHIHKKQKKDSKKNSKPSNQNDSITSIERTIAQKAYSILQEIQRPLMNLPQATEDWESALGQLKLLGYGDYAHYNTIFSSKDDTSHVSSGGDENNATSSRDGIGKCSSNVQDQREFALHVVHRLDCQVSKL